MENSLAQATVDISRARQTAAGVPLRRKVPGIASDSSLAAQCTLMNCPLAKGQVLVPIKVQGNVTGYVLSCSNNDQARAVREIAATLVSDSIASQAYSEFELNSLSTKILERYEEINLLYDMGQTLGGIFDADTIYQTVLEKMTEVIGTQKAWITIVNKEDESLHLTVARGLPQVWPFLRVIKIVFLILVFSLGMAAIFLKRLGSAPPAGGSSAIVPTSGISPNLFKMSASAVGFGKAIVIAVSPFQEPPICSIRD